MIHIKYNGGFGNCLFQYTFARLIAIKFNYHLDTIFKFNNIINTTNYNGQLQYNTPKIVINNGFPDDLEPALYMIDGFFQNYDYYKNNKTLIKSFFVLDTSKIAINKKDICLHIRLTDYWNLNWVINPSYYLNILEQETFNKVYIITDDVNDPYLNNFKKYNPIIISESPKTDFYKLMEFDKIILSNSSFAWWAMFLGNSSKIYTFKRWVRHKPRINDHLKDLAYLNNAIVIDGDFFDE